MLTFMHANRLLGAILMVSGCCIGAGMLGLPLVTATAGFFPTIAAFLISWVFMLGTGLLLLEVNLWFGKGVNLMTLAERTLGRWTRLFIACLFAFLFYCLMVAYLAGGGILITEYAEQLVGVSLHAYLGSMILVILFGAVVFLGTHSVDLFNRFLMLGVALSYAGLIAFGLPHIDRGNLVNSQWGYVLPALPAMIISFGFHNLVPSLTDYLEGNARQLRLAICLGSAIPLVVYLLWDTVILGILPSGGATQEAIDSGAMVTSLLRDVAGVTFIAHLMQAFAFFALVTSFLTVSLSFVDFLADGLGVKKTASGSLLLVGLVLVPPSIFTFLYPSIFLDALNYAGAFGAVILFGIFPVVMAWKGRYIDKRVGARLVPGGKVSLMLLGVFAVFIFFMQLKIELGVWI